MGNIQRRILAPSLIVWLTIAANLSAQTADQVNQAIDRGLDFLKAKQRIDGSWEDVQYTGGVTALASLALLSCDVAPDDPRIQKALDNLRAIPPSNTYVVALQTMAFAEATPKDDAALILRNARWLMSTRGDRGAWSYGNNQGGGSGDNSNTQYALLGLQASADAGAEIPDKFWERCRDYWIKVQSNVGSWGYQDGGATGSMTAAGISSLVIANRATEEVQKGLYNGMPVRCNGALPDRNLELGLQWMGRNFSVSRNPNGQETWLYYYLYGLERASRLSGRRFLGDHDWFREGVRFLVGQQRPDGSWSNGGRELVLCDTAFALLFLSKGRIPIVVNKLQYGQADDWNKSPNDVNNLTELMSEIWQKKLNWQVVNLNVAKVEDLLEAPVIQFSGHAPPRFTDSEKALLKSYVEQGGYILADANCSVPEFDAGFRRLCKELWPETPLQPLEEGHGVWNSLFELRPNWPLHGIEVSCRTAVFYSPEDLSCQWQYKKDPNSLTAFRIGANVIAYATAPENLKRKLDQVRLVDEGTVEDEVKRNFLQIAKIRHNGDWNPAPRAIANLLTSLRETAKVDVVRQPREIDILSPNFDNHPLSYMHGRYRFTMTPLEKQRLGKYLKFGGVMFADACCGSEQFDEAFRLLMRELFPDNPFKPIPGNHELMTADIGYDLSQMQMSKALDSRVGPPVLEGIEIDGRFVVIYSKFDLGCAMERQQSIACRGYTHDSAIKIATNIVLYSLSQ